MAFWIDEMPTHGTGHNDPNWRGFKADSLVDIFSLPTSLVEGSGGMNEVDNKKCAVGSECTVIAEGAVYILNSNNEWKGLGEG